MNIPVTGRIRPLFRGERLALKLDDQNKVAARSGGPYFGFLELHSEKNTTYDVFKSSIQSAVDIFLGGCNACILIGGESGSGKSYTMAGEGVSKSGLVPLIIDYIFARLAKETYSADRKLSMRNQKVTLQMFEVYDEIIKDLLQIPVGGAGCLLIEENSEKSVYLKNASQLSMRDSIHANAEFRQAWGRRTQTSTDYGLSANDAAVFCQIEVDM